ncbi:MAG TPA: class I SAM-dependent methyltransferase [Pirellulales bacterium]|nr:class I SAM-dependent methyltransferase [Pirellulales bacterium]
MFTSDQYQLLDFGDGRKLERFGAVVLDRPAPAAAGNARHEPSLWPAATGRYDRTAGDCGVWRWRGNLPEPWTILHDKTTLELKPTEFGHLGLFPEQADQWDWIAEQVRRAPKPAKVLNLFAYTGAATFAAAGAGAEVTHVDSARNTVAWARRNAQRSGLTAAPIRWIVEDASRFVRRELKRGNQYHAVVLDPPSYGRGPKGEVWKLEDQLPDLLRLCAELTADDRRFMLLSCHSPGYDGRKLGELLLDVGATGEIETMAMATTTRSGRSLASGCAARLRPISLPARRVSWQS